MKVFINKDFVKKYYLNIYKISKAMLVYNINGTLNKASQTSKVLDIDLYYQTYIEQILFTVSSPREQNLIFRLT